MFGYQIICLFIGVSDNEIALEEFRRIMLEIMWHEKQQILVCCLDDDSDGIKLVGVSKMTVIERNASKSIHDYKVSLKNICLNDHIIE